MIYRYLMAVVLLAMGVGNVFAEQALISPFEEKPVVFADPGSSQTREVAGTVTARWKLNVRISPWGTIIDGFKPGKKVTIVAREGGRAEFIAREHARIARQNLEYVFNQDPNLLQKIPGLALIRH